MIAVEHPEPPRMTEAEYLAFEAESEGKHEYSRGRVYAMTGAMIWHNTIVMNVGTQLNIQLAARDCTVTSSDTRVHIARKHAYRYPNVTVFCGAPAYLDERRDTITNPAVLVEVLSPGSALIDRNEKLREYTQIESLHAYLLVAQDEARVERYLRHESGEWLYSVVSGLDGEVVLPALDCVLALSLIYRKVRFDDPGDDVS